jgi:Holliday junction resolvase RusA-like endonuclease
LKRIKKDTHTPMNNETQENELLAALKNGGNAVCPVDGVAFSDDQPQCTADEDKGVKTLYSVRLVVAGTPRPQPRPRFAKGRVVSTVDPVIQHWQNSVCEKARMARYELTPFQAKSGVMSSALSELSGKGKPVKLDITFYFGTRHQNRWGTPHTKKPDIDNLTKLIMDQLVKAGLLMGDDCKVSTVCARKFWCSLPGSGVIILMGPDNAESAFEDGLRHKEETQKPNWL